MSSCYNPLQDTGPITSAVLGHLVYHNPCPIDFSQPGQEVLSVDRKMCNTQGWGQIRFIKYKYKYKYKNLDFSNTNTNTNIFFNFDSNTNTNTNTSI